MEQLEQLFKFNWTHKCIFILQSPCPLQHLLVSIGKYLFLD